jgi:hypothetical protein
MKSPKQVVSNLQVKKAHLYNCPMTGQDCLGAESHNGGVNNHLNLAEEKSQPHSASTPMVPKLYNPKDC